MFLQFSVGLADVYVAGRFGPSVQGAVGFAAQTLFLFTVLANAIGIGLVASIARSQGAGRSGEAWNAARQGMLLAVGLAGLLGALGVGMSPPARHLAFLPGPVAASAEALLPWYAGALLPQSVLAVASAVFRARRTTVWVLVCAGVMAILNLAGDFALAFGYFGLPAMGPRGIALATAASSAAGAVLAVGALLAQGLREALRERGLQIETVFARELFRVAWPAGLLQVGWNLGTLVLYAILGRLASGAVEATAALTNGLRIEGVLYLPAFALNMTAAVLVGQALGAGNALEAEHSGWRVAGAAAAVLTALALPVFLWSREFAGLLTPDPVVREATHLYLRYNMASQPFMALSVCLGGGLQGAGDTRGTMRVVLGALWAIRLPLAAVLALTTPLAAVGVWAAMVTSQVIQGIWMAVRFRRGKWKSVGP
jgi:putative MATE family efflux protein